MDCELVDSTVVSPTVVEETVVEVGATTEEVLKVPFGVVVGSVAPTGVGA